MSSSPWHLLHRQTGHQRHPAGPGQGLRGLPLRAPAARRSEEAYLFTATIDGLDITGCDFLTLDEDGKITEFMVMIRPRRASQALAGRIACERYQGHRCSFLRGCARKAAAHMGCEPERSAHATRLGQPSQAGPTGVFHLVRREATSARRRSAGHEDLSRQPPEWSC